MTKKKKFLLSALALSLLAGGLICLLCFVFSPAPKSALSLSAGAITLPVSSSKPIELSCSVEDAEIGFEVYDESIAFVDNGIVKGLKIGKTSIRITATYDGKTAVAVSQVSVTENLEGPINDLPTSVVLYVLNKNVEQANADGYFNMINFNSFRSHVVSSTSNIVKVDKSSIRAVKEGVCVVTFLSTNSSVKSSISIEVREIDAKLEGVPDEITLAVDQTYNLSPNVAPSYFSGDAAIDLVSNSGAISISENVITAVSGGRAEVEVLLNGKLAKTCEVIVAANVSFKLTPLSNCIVSPTTIQLLEETARLAAVIVGPDQKALSIANFTVSAHNVEFKRELNVVVISARTAGSITFSCYELNCFITLQVLPKT